MKIIVFIVILVIYFCKFSDKKESDIAKITIEIKDEDPVALFSDVFTDYELIPLETTEQSIIGSVSQMVVNPNKIIIMDLKVQQILAFDKKTGKFLHKIGSMGGAPYEYIHPEYMIYDEFKDLILVKDGLRKIVVYKSDGTFVRTIPMKKDIPVKSIAVVGNDRIALNVRRGYKYNYDIRIIDYTGKEISHYLPYNSQKNICGFNSFSKTANGTTLYACSFYDNIYAVSSDTVIPVYKVDYLNHNAPKDIYEYNRNESRSAFDIDENVASLMNFTENEHVIFTECFLHNNSHATFISKKTNQSVTGMLFVDDLKGIVYTQGIGYNAFIDKDKFISYIPAEQMAYYGKSLCLKLKEENKSIDLDNIYDYLFRSHRKQISACLQRAKKKTIDESDLQFLYSITEESNPIIMIADLKQDISF